jgi:hypothetical protein
MRMIHFLAALLIAGGTALSALGADLSRIDRTIAKEPRYQHRPKYCLLILGPKATKRIWLVVDGNTLYVDRNGNGDLTEKGQSAVWPGAKILVAGRDTGPDGKAQHTLSLRKFPASMRLTVRYEGKETWIVGDPDDGPLVFADRPSDAPIIHVGGPLAIHLSYYGAADTWALRVRIGTPGRGTDAIAGLVVPQVTPVVEIAFPARQPGGKPIVQKVLLRDR